MAAVRSLYSLINWAGFTPCGASDGPTGGAAVARAISEHVASGPGYGHVVATKDFHVDPGSHFSDHPDYAASWPPHCVAGTTGADFYPELDTSAVEATFRKGQHAAAYSGFEGSDDNGTPLGDWLRGHGVDEVDVVGIATDYCVRCAVEGLAGRGYPTALVVDAIRAVNPADEPGLLTGFALRGVLPVSHTHLTLTPTYPVYIPLVVVPTI